MQLLTFIDEHARALSLMKGMKRHCHMDVSLSLYVCIDSDGCNICRTCVVHLSFSMLPGLFEIMDFYNT